MLKDNEILRIRKVGWTLEFKLDITCTIHTEPRIFSVRRVITEKDISSRYEKWIITSMIYDMITEMQTMADQKIFAIKVMTQEKGIKAL